MLVITLIDDVFCVQTHCADYIGEGPGGGWRRMGCYSTYPNEMNHRHKRYIPSYCTMVYTRESTCGNVLVVFIIA